MSGSWIIPTAIAGVMALIGVAVFIFSLTVRANQPNGDPENRVGARDATTGPRA